MKGKTQQEEKAADIKIGMKVGYRDMANPYHEGIIVDIIEKKPGSFMLFGKNGGMEAIKKEAVVIYPDRWTRTNVPFNDLSYHDHAGHRLVDAEPVSPQKVKEIKKEYERMQPILRKQEEEKRKQKKQAEEQQKEEYVKQFPYLTDLRKANQSSWAGGAKNLKKELKKQFPNTKFSVKSESYSMGSSINVSWKGDPDRESVEKIASKYKEGSFDGMTDMYNYSDEVWTNVFGGAKYVFCQKEE